MIIKGNATIRTVSGISEKQESEIYSFLQGTVYCWCKNLGDKEFALRDLMGGENFQWNGTPLSVLWEKQKKIGCQ